MFVHHWYDLSGPGGLRRPGWGTAEGLRGHNASFFTPPDPITPFLALEMKEGSVIGRGGASGSNKKVKERERASESVERQEE